MSRDHKISTFMTPEMDRTRPLLADLLVSGFPVIILTK